MVLFEPIFERLKIKVITCNILKRYNTFSYKNTDRNNKFE